MHLPKSTVVLAATLASYANAVAIPNAEAMPENDLQERDPAYYSIKYPSNTSGWSAWWLTLSTSTRTVSSSALSTSTRILTTPAYSTSTRTVSSTAQPTSTRSSSSSTLTSSRSSSTVSPTTYVPPPPPPSSSSTPPSSSPRPTSSSTSSRVSSSSTSSSANLPFPTAGGNCPSYSQMILNNHNTHRANHSAPALYWNATIAAHALEWAEGCVFAHNTSYGEGQNLALGYQYPQDGVQAWYNTEAANFSPFYGQATPDMSKFGTFGHFSQIVWKGSRSVGCATVVCPSISGFTNAQYTVCNYYPPGNYLGQFDQNVGTPLNYAAQNSVC